MFKRRYIYEGWNNWSQFEKDYIQKVKQEIKKQYKIDLDVKKDYGPRTATGFVKEGENKVVNGSDADYRDTLILRFCYGRNWKLDDIVKSLKYHFEWRQSFIPYPILNDETLKLLKTGLFYLHGRCMDHSPILVLNFAKLSDLLKRKQIYPENFCALHNLFARYMIKNMLIPGQVERWVIIANIN